MKILTLITIFLLAQAAIAGEKTLDKMNTHTWSIGTGAAPFVMTIGQQCLTDTDAQIDADGKKITVFDGPACSREIETLSKAWEKATGETIVTLNGSPESLTARKKQIMSRYASVIGKDIRFLAETRYCHCLVLAGPLSVKAAESFVGPKKPRKEMGKTKFDQGEIFDPLSKNIRPQGLIWRVEKVTIHGVGKPLM